MAIQHLNMVTSYASWDDTPRFASLLRFCARLGFGDDIETAEEKRSRRLGKRRATWSLWILRLSTGNHRKGTMGYDGT